MDHINDLALYDAVQRWAREIQSRSNWTVETILVTGEKLLAAYKDLAPHGPKARAMLAAETRLSRPMMSKLEAIGRHAAFFRPRAANLPPHISSLYALTRKPFGEFSKLIERDIRGMTRTDIARLSAPAPGASRLRLMTISIPGAVGDETRREVMVDIRDALRQIAEGHGIEITATQPKIPFQQKQMLGSHKRVHPARADAERYKSPI
jgi:hypothetical protein